MTNGSLTIPLQDKIACPVPQGLILPSGTVHPSGILLISWKTYSTWICFSIRLPITSLNSFSMSFLMIKTTLLKPASKAS